MQAFMKTTLSLTLKRHLHLSIMSLIIGSFIMPVSGSETARNSTEFQGDFVRVSLGRALYNLTYQSHAASNIKTKKAGINSFAIGTDINTFFKQKWPVILSSSLEFSQSDKSSVSDDGTVSQVYIRYNGLMGLDYPFANAFKFGISLGYGKTGQQILAVNQSTASLWGFSPLYQAQCSYQYPFSFGKIGAQLAFRKDLVTFSNISYANGNNFTQVNQQNIQTRFNLFYGF
jgi:hypothetical protein